jgi:hypothetical protein
MFSKDAQKAEQIVDGQVEEVEKGEHSLVHDVDGTFNSHDEMTRKILWKLDFRCAFTQ